MAINFDTLTVLEAWNLLDTRDHNTEQITHKELFDKRFSNILLSAPRVDDTIIVNGYSIDFCDCFLYLCFRVSQISDKWIIYFQINSYNSELSWQPESVRFGENDMYLISTDTWELFEIKINE